MVFFKKIIGSPRPNFFSLTALVEYNNHTYHNALLEERYQNEPSGHSSTAVSTMLYLSFYLSAKFKIYMPMADCDPVRNTLCQFGYTACYLPFTIGLWIAATRVQDFWHTPAAITEGMLLGGTCAAFAWQITSFYTTDIWQCLVLEKTNKVGPSAVPGSDPDAAGLPKLPPISPASLQQLA
jgi:membrane-associated phospholipid phosphatase